MVGVAVGVNHSNNRFLRTMLEVKVKCGFCGRRRHQWVDNNNAFLALNECNVRDILAAHLIHFIGDFEQARNAVDLRLTPQAGVYGFRRSGINIKFVIIRAVVNFAVSITQNTFIQQRSDKSTLGIVKILTIAKR